MREFSPQRTLNKTNDMDEIIKWGHVENSMAKQPIRGQPYLVKGFIIDKGSRKRVIRLTWFTGSSFEECDDMVIETYASVHW